MKLKYYLRGAGIGIIGTTIIFMILIALGRAKAQSIPKPDVKPQTVASLENSTEGMTEDLVGQGQPDGTEGTPDDTQENGQDTQGQEEVPQGEEAPAPQPDKQESAQQPEKTDAVRFEIKGGEYSDRVSKKLEEAGLIDDAAAFNDFLIKENYDNSIIPGTYEIPKDSVYEEIALILMGRK